MRREKWMALAVLPVLLLAGDFVYWRAAVSQLHEGFAAWIALARTEGWDVRYGALTTGGWPDAVTLRIEDVTLSGLGSGSGVFGLTGGSEAVLLRVRLTRPDVLEIMPLGLRPVRFNDGPPVPVSAGHLQLRFTLELNAPPSTVDIDAGSLTVTLPGLGLISVGRLNLRAGLKPDAGRDQAAVTFSAAARPISLPDGVHWGLGSVISDAAVEGVLNGPLPPGPGLAARATAWRDGGGSLELHRLAITWGPARVDATATLALDEDLQPMGAGTGKIVGYGAALDALAANAELSRSAATAAKAVLSLLANPSAEGQPEEVEVPLALQFRTLSVRQVPLVRLPELDWPDR